MRTSISINFPRLIATASVAILPLGGCHSLSPTLSTGPTAYQVTGTAEAGAPQTEYRIATADVLNVNVLYEPDVSVQSARVDSNGDIQVPMIGAVHAVGRTATELSQMIQQQLGARYLRNPIVTVSVTDFSRQRVAIEGQVEHPGVYDIPHDTSLLDAVALAQGPTRTAALNQVIVFRTINGQRMGAVFDLRRIRYGYDKDPLILAGDTVVVGYSEVKGVYRDFLSAAPALSVFRPY
jgi:polysaccharide export outer membrane protein